MTSSLITLVAAETEHTRELPLPEWAFGLISLAFFAACLALLWSFRNTAASHIDHQPKPGERH